MKRSVTSSMFGLRTLARPRMQLNMTPDDVVGCLKMNPVLIAVIKTAVINEFGDGV